MFTCLHVYTYRCTVNKRTLTWDLGKNIEKCIQPIPSMIVASIHMLISQKHRSRFTHSYWYLIGFDIRNWYFDNYFFCWYLRPLTRDLLVLLARQDPESFMTPGLLFNRVTSSQTNSKRFWIIPKHAKTFQIYTKSYQITPGIKKECFGMFLQGRLTSEID